MPQNAHRFPAAAASVGCGSRNIKYGDDVKNKGIPNQRGVNLQIDKKEEFCYDQDVKMTFGGQTTGYGRKSFDYLVNPIFLYMDEYHAGELTYYKNSESEKNYFKTFWYGNGKELKDVY